MRIAYFSPLSPLKSGIVDYSEIDLLPFLKKYCEIDLYIDSGYKPTNHNITKNFKIYNYKEFVKKADRYDTILYHIGNNPLHAYIYKILKKYPGIIILHDLFIHGLIHGITLAKGDKLGYINEFFDMYGTEGKQFAESTMNSQNFAQIEFKYPLIKSILDSSNGIIVHSAYGKRIILRENPDIAVKVINFPVIPFSSLNIDSTKTRNGLGLNEDTLIIGLFGFISSHKRIVTVLKTFGKFHKEFPNCTLLIVGEDNLGLKNLINDLNIKAVIQTGFVSFKRMYEYMQVSDICINLRYPTAGETSASILRLMSIGKPVIVSNVGWFSELPDNCCAKVDVDNFEEDLLLEYLRVLAVNEQLRVSMGKNARNFVEKEHNCEIVARKYYYFMKEVVKGITVKKIGDVLIQDIIQDMDESGIL